MAAEKPTKYCTLNITLVNGVRLTGRFHIEARTSSTIRPSDAIRQCEDGWLLLTDVEADGSESPQADTLMIPVKSIAWIELPAKRWTTPPAPLQAGLTV